VRIEDQEINFLIMLRQNRSPLLLFDVSDYDYYKTGHCIDMNSVDRRACGQTLLSSDVIENDQFDWL